MSYPPTDIELEIKILRREHCTACRELKEIKQLAALRRRESSELELKWQIAALRVESAFLRHAYVRLKSGFDPGQPRIPAGSPGGGQWTTGGPNALRDDPVVISDANPDPVRPGAQYAQTMVVIKPAAITNDQRIDDTTVKLTTTLGHAMDIVEPTPGLSPQAYGRMVHEHFADMVRVAGLPGIARDDVETTFGGAYYGAKGSIRTDVVLRNDAGEVIAIYDVKTGDATIGAMRAAELRTKVGVDNRVPILELQAIHGVDRKNLAPRLVYATRQNGRNW